MTEGGFLREGYPFPYISPGFHGRKTLRSSLKAEMPSEVLETYSGRSTTLQNIVPEHRKEIGAIPAFGFQKILLSP